MKAKYIGNLLVALFLIGYCVCLIPFAVLTPVLIWCGVEKKCMGFFWYNTDRAMASGALGTSQETISSEVGRIAIGAGKPDGWTPRWKWQASLAIDLARWLNGTPKIWGVDHTARAISHANALDAVDDGREQ